MKKIIFLCLITLKCLGQLPYTWTTNINPSWASTNSGSGSTLTWQTCSVVTTNCTGNYSNNQNTFYTSPVITATCSSASSVNITFSASGNAEFGYDFLFVEYSLNAGTTWINPYGAGTGWTGNFGAGYTIPPITVPTSNQLRFRFNFRSDNTNRNTGYKITDFDIACNVVLPIELLSFQGESYNTFNNIMWSSITETNNDYYTIEKSCDAINFTELGKQYGKGNSTSINYYQALDNNPCEEISYYRLKQTDFDGTTMIVSNIIALLRTSDNKGKVVKIYNLLGQEVNKNFEGLKIYYYDNGNIVCQL